MKEMLKDRISEHIGVVSALLSDEKTLADIESASKKIVDTYKNGGKLLICGNGGSAADAQHIAAELVSRFYMERRALNAEALTVNTSSITAIGNDYSFDKIFARQVEAKGARGDILLGISTSGNSPNVIAAMETAKTLGMYTIGFGGGNSEAKIFSTADICIGVPTRVTPRVQECHILIGHIICEYIEATLFRP